MKSWSSHHCKFFPEHCRRVVSDCESTFGSTVNATKHNALWLCTTRGHSLPPKRGAQRSGCSCLHVCLLRWPEAWIRWKNNSRLVRSTLRSMGQETTSLLFQSYQGRNGGWHDWFSGILIGRWPDSDGNVHHWPCRFLSRKIFARFLFLRLSRPVERWCDARGTGSSSFSTLYISRDANHLWWLPCPPVCLLSNFP